MNMYYNNISKLPNKAYIDCKVCHGFRYVKEKNIFIKKMCKHCGGNGKLDWIENITGIKEEKSKYNKDLEQQLTYENARLLSYTIKELLEDTRNSIRVTIDLIPRPDYYMRPLISSKHNQAIDSSRDFQTIFVF